MEVWVKLIAHYIAMGCEIATVVVLAMGAIKAFVRSVANWRLYDDLEVKKEIWLRFAGSLMLALEFALAADIAETAVSPTWEELGQLAAIAAIRTFLNYFLEKDLAETRELEIRPRGRGMRSRPNDATEADV